MLCTCSLSTPYFQPLLLRTTRRIFPAVTYFSKHPWITSALQRIVELPMHSCSMPVAKLRPSMYPFQHWQFCWWPFSLKIVLSGQKKFLGTPLREPETAIIHQLPFPWQRPEVFKKLESSNSVTASTNCIFGCVPASLLVSDWFWHNSELFPIFCYLPFE